MKVCLVNTVPRDQVQSAETRVNEWASLINPSVEGVWSINVECPKAGDPLAKLVLGELKAWVKLSQDIMSLKGDNTIHDMDVILWKGRLSTIIMPLLLARFVGKRSVLLLESRGSDLVGQVYGGGVLRLAYRLLEKIACYSADRLVSNVPGLLQGEWLGQYDSKVFPDVVAARSIGNDFVPTIPISQRKPIAGYIGRLSAEKGVKNLIDTIPLVDGVQFVFVGDGELSAQAHSTGWVERKHIVEYLNKMKVLVVPSEYEGLPTVVPEAMACGTPVLATKVGAIPDLIEDGWTGFLMDDNAPQTIAEGIRRVFDWPDLGLVSKRAYDLVQSRYTNDKMKESWGRLLKEVQ